MLYGVFHGDLHGGNLMVQPDGRTVLMDFGITGRLDETKRLAFLMLLVGATSGDTMAQLGALRDLGAFPPDTDLDAVFTRPRSRPHDRPDAALGRRAGARAAGPHEEAARVRRPRAEGAHAVREEHDVPRRRDRAPRARPRHPRRDPAACTPRSRCATARASRPSSASIPRSPPQFDMDAVKAAMGVPDVEKLTYREVQERRELIRQRLEAEAHVARGRALLTGAMTMFDRRRSRGRVPQLLAARRGRRGLGRVVRRVLHRRRRLHRARPRQQERAAKPCARGSSRRWRSTATIYTAYEWHMVDDDGRVVVYMQNRRDHPEPEPAADRLPGHDRAAVRGRREVLARGGLLVAARRHRDR